MSFKFAVNIYQNISGSRQKHLTNLLIQQEIRRLKTIEKITFSTVKQKKQTWKLNTTKWKLANKQTKLYNNWVTLY